MPSKIAAMEKELEALVEKAHHLFYALLKDTGYITEDMKKKIKEKNIKLPDFLFEYNGWYSEALIVVKQLLPDRLEDFISQYKNDKRKSITSDNYVILDYLNGSQVKIDGKYSRAAAIMKMQNQWSIVESVKKCFKSSLCNIQGILEADIFDSELLAAEALLKKGFLRPAGVIAGVVLEKHLGHICENHSVLVKKDPTISDCLQPLKDSKVIDIPVWRKLQCLGDLRNLCSHNKDREPSKEEVLELIKGVEKAIKTVW